jgi:hypothetical protein
MVRNREIAAWPVIVSAVAATIVIAGCSVRIPTSALRGFRLSPPVNETSSTELQTSTAPKKDAL